MKRLLPAIITAAIVSACAFAAVAPFVAPSSYTGTTNEVAAFPSDAVGAAYAIISQTGVSTNAPAVYELLTYNAATNLVTVNLTAPVTAAVEAVEIWFPAQAINGRIALKSTCVSNVTRSAVIQYTPRYQ